MKMYVLDGGKMFLDESALLAGIHGASLRTQHPAARWVDIPVNAFLVELDSGYLLYDTGCNASQADIPDDEDTPSPFVYSSGQLLPERLAQLGVKTEDVKYVVMSHLHCDHAGYLYLFKNAEVIVSDTEFTQSMRLYGLRGFGKGPYMYSDFESFLSAGLKWKLIAPETREYKVCDGVTVVNYGPGHSFGMMGMLLELSNSGNFLMCADALYRSENLGPPVRVPGLIFDSVSFVKSANFIAEYAEARGAKILFGHDKAQFATLRKSTEGFYD